MLPRDAGNHEIIWEKVHLAPMRGISWQLVEFSGKEDYMPILYHVLGSLSRAGKGSSCNKNVWLLILILIFHVLHMIPAFQFIYNLTET